MNFLEEKSLYLKKIQQLKTKFELVLLEKAPLNECTVIVNKTYPLEVVPYIVSSSNNSLKQIRSYLQNVSGEALLPKAVVQGSNIP